MKRFIGIVAAMVFPTVALIGMITLFDANSVEAEVSNTAQLSFPSQIEAAEAAAVWLVTNHQNMDGGYADFSFGADQADSSVNGTLDAILGIASTGYNPALPLAGKTLTPLDYFSQNLSALVAYANTSGGQAGKLVMGLTAMRLNPNNFQGIDFVKILESHAMENGQYDATPFNHSLAMLGLASANEPIPQAAVTWLNDNQESAGSWTDGFGTTDNVDATAMSIMALLAAGVSVSDTIISDASTFLVNSQTGTGGWGYDQAATFGENANSTALVIQASSAMGEDFYSSNSPYIITSTAPISVLLGYQSPTGAYQVDFGSGPSDNFFATVQAMIGATGRAFPLPARYEAAAQGVACLDNIQDPASAGWAQFGDGAANAAGTSRAIEALVAFGADPVGSSYTFTGTTPVDALGDLAGPFMTNGGRVGVVMQGVVAAQGDVSNFAGYNLPISMTNYITAAGRYAPTNFGILAHAEGMLGLNLAGESVDPNSIPILTNEVMTDDLWSDNDQTGIAINVLSRLGEMLPTETLTSLQNTQFSSGGWEAGFGGFSVNSTSEVVQGLAAAGEYPFAPRWSTVSNGVLTNSADATINAQAENGCWQPFGGDDAYSTTDGILLLMIDEVSPEPSLLVSPTVQLFMPMSQSE